MRVQMPGRPSRWRKPRIGLSAATAAVLGSGVAIAVPLQRRNPALVFGLSIAEVAALVLLVVTTHVAALIALILLAAALVGAAATNGRRVLAITSSGVVVLAASARGRPIAPIGSAPDDLALPEPAGLGVEVLMGGTRWWVERSAFPRLRQARTLLGQSGDHRP